MRLLPGTLIALASLLFASSPSWAAGEPTIRVLLAERLSGVLVKGRSLSIETTAGAKVIDGVSRASFQPSSGLVALGGSEARAPGFAVAASDEFCEVNGSVVRGKVLVLAPQGGTAQGLLLVGALPLESYLVGLVNGEVNSAWPLEAVKAQVVAARTYALWRMGLARGEPWDVKPDTSHQVYPGVFGEDADAARAVRATRGQVLMREGKPLQALFHSTCGGRTASAEEVWGSAVPGIESVECRDCGGSPQARWELMLPADELSAAVNRLYPGTGAVASLAVRNLTPSGRVRSLSVTARGGAFLVDAGDLRREVGAVRLPSTAFSVKRAGDGFLFTGRGYGHGAGLCQWGARGAAARGAGYAEILGAYYQGAEIKAAWK